MATAVNGWHWGVDFIKARNVESYNKKDKNTLFANKIISPGALYIINLSEDRP